MGTLARSALFDYWRCHFNEAWSSAHPCYYYSGFIVQTEGGERVRSLSNVISVLLSLYIIENAYAASEGSEGVHPATVDANSFTNRLLNAGRFHFAVAII